MSFRMRPCWAKGKAGGGRIVMRLAVESPVQDVPTVQGHRAARWRGSG